MAPAWVTGLGTLTLKYRQAKALVTGLQYLETNDNITSEFIQLVSSSQIGYNSKYLAQNRIVLPDNMSLRSIIGNSQNSTLQSEDNGGIINNNDTSVIGDEVDGQAFNQGTVGGGVQEEIYTGRESQMGKNRETIDGYVTGGKAEILSGVEGKTPRRVRINHTENSSVTFTEGTEDGTDGYKVYTAFVNAGIKAIYCQGQIERTVKGVTVTRTEAFTAPDGTVYISSESTLPPKQRKSL